MSNRDGIGAKDTVIAEGHRFVQEVQQRFELYLQ